MNDNEKKKINTCIFKAKMWKLYYINMHKRLVELLFISDIILGNLEVETSNIFQKI